MDELVAIHHVALTVTDCEQSAAWYTGVLRMEVQFRESGEERRACVLRFRNGASSVGLVEHLPGSDGAFDHRTVGLDHAAFTVGTRADLDEWAEHLDRHGVEHSGVIDIPPGAILNFRDPDGIGLALFWDAPGPR